MKARGAKRCLPAATISFLMALPFGVAAQGEAQQNEQQAAQQPEATQRLFVSDKLVLNVYAQADQDGARVATIETGEAVEALGRANNFVHVRLQDGREGWVGAKYLTSDAPATVRLRELRLEQQTALQNAQRRSAEEVVRLKKEAAALQAQVDALKSPAASAPAASVHNVTSAPEERTAETRARHEPQPAALASADASSASWMWPLIAVLASGLGFAAGYRKLASRIRKKYGGLKIY